MAAAQPARFRAPGDDIANWMAERWRDIANLGPEAEDAGRRLWALATRSGQDISAPNPSDVYALGAQFLNGGTANSAAASQQQPDQSQSAAPDTGDNPTDDDGWSDYPWLGGDATFPPAFGQGGLLQLAAASGKGFWDYWSIPGCANCHGYSRPTSSISSGPNLMSGPNGEIQIRTVLSRCISGVATRPHSWKPRT